MSDVSDSDNIDVTTRAAVVPSGWSTVTTGNGTALYRKGAEDTYVVMANLKTGAKIGMVYDTPSSGQGTSSAKFPKKLLTTWNTYGTFFAIANSLYFDTGSGNPCDFPFPFKQGGIFETLGDGGSSSDKLKEKAALNVYSNYADIVTIGYDPMTTILMVTDKSYAGFQGSITNANNAGTNTGRTLVGLKDEDGNGTREVVYLLVASSKTQSVAYNILTQDFGCSKVITFDGGGSTQLMCNGVSKVVSSDPTPRTVPIAIVIKENGVN